MKVIVLGALLTIVLIQVVDSADKNNQRLRCHSCTSSSACKKHHEVDCLSEHDTCQRIHMPIYSPSGNENRDNYYADTSQDIMVLERLCTTETRCERAKRKKHRSLTVECCKESLCNA